MLTSTERSRRSRLHARGDHSLCDPRRDCAGATAPTFMPGPAPAPPSPPVPVASVPERRAPGDGLSERSQALHDELAPDLNPLSRLLLVEALRIADRLDYMDRLIAGKQRRGEWLRLQEGDAGEMRVVVDDLLAEARQHGTALKTMLADLVKVLPKQQAKDAPVKVSAIASLADAAARRRAGGA
jgi:hypothetical protein